MDMRGCWWPCSGSYIAKPVCASYGPDAMRVKISPMKLSFDDLLEADQFGRQIIASHHKW